MAGGRASLGTIKKLTFKLGPMQLTEETRYGWSESVDPINFIKVLAVTFAALFPVVNPIGDAPIFLSLTRHYSQSAQEILSRKIAAYGFALLAGSFLFGSEILSFFGVTLAVIQITGGLIVASTGWSLLNQQRSE